MPAVHCRCNSFGAVPIQSNVKNKLAEFGEATRVSKILWRQEYVARREEGGREEERRKQGRMKEGRKKGTRSRTEEKRRRKEERRRKQGRMKEGRSAQTHVLITPAFDQLATMSDYAGPRNIGAVTLRRLLSPTLWRNACAYQSPNSQEMSKHMRQKGNTQKKCNNMEQIVRPHCAHAKKHNCDANMFASATRPEHLAYVIPCLRQLITWHKFRYHLLEMRSRSQRPLHHSNHRTQMMMEP